MFHSVRKRAAVTMKEALSNLDSACLTWNLAQGLRLRSVIAVLMLVVLTESAFATLIIVSPQARADSAVPSASASDALPQQLLWSDDFTNDTSLNPSLWQANGPLGSLAGPSVCGACGVVPLEPTFSSAGMEIAQVKGEDQVGTIQSNESFAPPFTTNATVEGTVSNGKPFIFSVVSADGTAGVAITGDLNPDNCDNGSDCGNPDTCAGVDSEGGCFYGIGVKTAIGGDLVSQPKLYLTPTVDVFYTMQISVDDSGNAQYNISEDGRVLGESSTYIGTGPFYVILMQSEGYPYSGTGPNVAYWQSVSVSAPMTCAAPSASLAMLPAAATASTTCASVSVYPTEPSFATITLNYKGQSLSSPIHVAVEKDSNFPLGLNVTLRLLGTEMFNKTLDLQPSVAGVSTVQLNVTLDCNVGECNQSGGTQLPTNYTSTIVARSGSYTQESVVQLQLLKAKWLIMLYCASDASLQGYMVGDVLEMVAASKANDNPAVGILVLFHTKETSANFPGNAVQPIGTNALYKVANGTITRVGDIWPEMNIFDPATLHKFLNTALLMMPADRNQLILADHGLGIRGFGSGGADSLSINQLATALTDISPRLDILSFDACYMSRIEVLYQLRSYASYFTASQVPVPGEGYDYKGFLGSLSQNPDQSTAAYLTVIVSTYGAKYANVHDEYLDSITLAAINSSKLMGVVSGLDALSVALGKDYAANDPTFNSSMQQVLSEPVRGDIRSLAEKILLSPQITDPSVKAAATALIANVKAAVIANTTNTNKMYEGISVTMFGRPRVPAPVYQSTRGIEAQLDFSDAANWLPLLQDINDSAPASSASWTILTLQHPGHQLYLNVYNSTGGHIGYNPALLNFSKTEIDIILGSYYLDFGNGTTVIALPSNMQSFRTVVDGSFMTEASEQYTLTYTVVQNGTVTSTKTVQGAMSQNALQSADVTIQNGVLAVGATTITTSTTSTTTSVTTTISSAASTTTSSSTGSTSSGSSNMTYLVAGIVVVAIIVVAIVILARRRTTESAPEARRSESDANVAT